MMWMTSDFAVLLLASSFILSVLAALFFCFRRFLENRIKMRHMDYLLKGMIVYMMFFMPVIAGCVLYYSTFHDIRYIEGAEEGWEWQIVIGNRSFSTETGLGNHPGFVILLMAWMLGVLYWGVYRSIKDIRVFHKMEKYASGNPDEEIRKQKEILQKEYGIKKPVDMLFNNWMDSPFTTGIFRKRIFFPQSGYEEVDREFMLRHELIHLKNRDAVFRRLLFWLCALYWFHPFVYRLADYFVEINEMACDEDVLRGRSKKERYQYASLLVNVAKSQEKKKYLKQELVFYGDTQSGLERRIENMKRNKIMVKKSFYVILVLALAAACPMSTFAAASGVSGLQSVAAQALVKEHEKFMEPDNFVEIYEKDENQNVREIQTDLGVKRSTDIDVTINGKEQVVVATLSLSKGDKVAVNLWSDNTTDKFRAGIKDSSDWKTYVNSSSGEIDHTFTVSASGTYKVFVEGTTDKDVHVTGGVIIRN